MASCGSCGQTSLSGDAMCDACRSGLYGASERHEAPRLFAPAPAQLAGQLDIRSIANAERLTLYEA